jgi:hypothetical protein
LARKKGSNVKVNTAQIKKLQKKVGKKVDKEISKRRETEEKRRKDHMIKMRENIIRYEKKYPTRGKCLCIWDGQTYLRDEKTNKVVAEPRFGVNKEMPKEFECVHTEKGKSYYMLTDYMVADHKKFMEWVANNYGIIKMAQVSMEKEEISAGDKLRNMFMLGKAGQEMAEKFPNKSIFDLREAVKYLDRTITGLK